MISEQEKKLLEKLDSGALDGIVGWDDSRRSTGRTYRKMIVDGTPWFLNFPTEEEPTRENVEVDGHFETDEMKLWFLQVYGRHMDDPDVKRYSQRYAVSNSSQQRDLMYHCRQTAKRMIARWRKMFKR